MLGVWLAWLTLQTAARFPWLWGNVFSFFSPARFAPFSAPLFWSHWLETGRNVLGLGVLLVSAFGLGAAGVRLWLGAYSRWSESGLSRLELGLAALGLGLAGQSCLLFGLGMAGLFASWVWPGFLAASAAYGVVQGWRRRALFAPGAGAWLGPGPVPWSDRILAGLLLALGGVALLIANAPEIFFDSLVYHLAVPAHWLRAGRIEPIPTNFFSNFPMGMEILYAGALKLGDERLCRLLHLALGTLATAGVFALGRRAYGRRTGLWGAGLFATVPLFMMNATQSGVDAASVFYAVLCLLVLLAWLQIAGSDFVRTVKFAVLAGVFAGAALAVKYNAFFVLLPAGLALCVAGWFAGKKIAELARLSLLGGVAALLLLSPWLAKNWVFTGNPVYPFFYSVFPSRHLQPEKMKQQMDGFKEYGRRTWGQFFLQPWTLTFGQATSNSYVGTNFLFLLPGLLWLAWRARRGPPAERWLLLTLGASALIWTSQTQIARYFIPAFPVFAVLGGRVLDMWESALPAAGRLGRWSVLGFAFWGLALVVGNLGLRYWDPLGVSLGLESRAAYLDRLLLNSYLPLARQISLLPARSKTMLFGESRAYYFTRSVTASTVYDEQPLLTWLDQGPTAEAVWKKLRQEGYSHLAVLEMEAVRTRGYEPYPWSPAALRRWQELQARYLTPLWVKNRQWLYALAGRPDLTLPVLQGRPLYACDPGALGKIIAHSAAAQEAVGRRDWQDARAEWMRIRELAPDWGEPYSMQAWLDLQAGDMEKAFAGYRRAAELTRLDAVASANLGILSLRRGEWGRARECLEWALFQEPDLEPARNALQALQQRFPAGEKR